MFFLLFPLFVFAFVLVYKFFPWRRRLPRQVSPTRRFSERHLRSHYDYVVVGSGPAASAFVARLLRDVRAANRPKILMLEAGPDLRDHEDVATSHSWTYNLHGKGNHEIPETDWGFETKFSFHGRHEVVGRGCMVGGSASINAQMWVLGDPKDWDGFKVDTWSWNNVRNVYNWLCEVVPTRAVATKNALYRDALKAYAALGLFQEVDDHNAAIIDGKVESPIAFCRQNNTPNKRKNPFDVLVEPLLNETDPAVTLIDSALVERLVLSDDDLTCTGVVFSVQGSGSFYVGARKEVVLAAGAFNTPQLLMLSGIGPQEELERHKIPLRKALPVGKDLIDHAFCGAAAFLKRGCDEITDASMLDVTGFFKSEWSKKNEPERGRDMQLAFYANPPLEVLHRTAARDLTTMLLIKPTASRYTLRGQLFTFVGRLVHALLTTTKILDKKLSTVFSMGVVLNHPRSRGSLRLRSSNPHDAPDIDLGLLNAPEDRRRLIEGIRKTVRIFTQEPFKQHVAELDPKAKLALEGSDQEVEEVVLKYGGHAWHPVATAAIGKVVDDRCRVIGVKGLRVADVSIMPNISSGNTMIPAFICGGRTAELVIADW